ncbi:MAG: hypothetical protein QOJ51_659 [Acidobacteriaceae bacterium]|jgi:hypothetical protein|nr:hypothetical protein [Acidobacteriaceae bacterium]
MHLSNLDSLLGAAGYLGNLCLAALLIRRRLYVPFPLFTASIIFALLSDTSLYWVLGHASEATYFRAYFAATILDFTFQLLVLAEIGLNVFNPVRKSLPKSAFFALAVLLVASAVLSFVLAPGSQRHSLSSLGSLYLRINLAFAILRLLVFAAVAGFAQTLGVGWKNHVLQLTTGLAFYSAVSLFTESAINHLSRQNLPSFEVHLHALNQIEIAAYIGTLVFWSWAFSRNEAPRKEFTPQMREVLVTIAGTARRTRLAVTRGLEEK